MPMLKMQNVIQGLPHRPGRDPRAARLLAGGGSGRVRRRHRPVGLGQDDVPQHRRPARRLRPRGRTCSTASTSARLSDREMSRIRNEKIGFIFQSFNLIPDLDVFDNVDVPLRYRGLPAPERKQRIERAVGHGRPRLAPAPPAGAALGRPAAARRDRARARRRAQADPRRRADRQPRLAMAREVMELLEQINEAGHDDRHGHPRPGARGARPPQLHIVDGRLVDLERIAPFPLNEPAGARPRQAAG